MSWFPAGPDFVFAPRDENFKRLSRRNEQGRQGLVSHITIDPTDPATIYVVERPSSGGSSAFRTQDDGESWVPIADSLQQVDANVDPSCIAVNPVHPATVYLGTLSGQGVYVSGDHGDSWGIRNGVPGSVRQIVVDARTAATLATTVLYAATDTGVYRSPDGGTSWVSVLAGDVWSLAAYIPSAGTAHFYAGVWQAGVFHATDPRLPANWTNLNTLGIGLPPHSASSITEPNGNFDAILVDFCPRNPSRVYAWMTKNACDAMGGNCAEVTAALYTTSAPLAAWSSVALASPPGPAYGFYAFAFAIAPNSPGDGISDVLFFGSVGLFRSIDAGRTWEGDAVGFHADQHTFAFSPRNPPAGVVPAIYVGCDGGIGVSARFCDPTISIAVAPTDFNEGFAYSDSNVYLNYNHGKQSSAVYQYASDPAVSALSYIGCQDTGIAAGNGGLGWRGIADADGGAIAVARGADGMKIWASLGAYNSWPAFRILFWTDRGEYSPAASDATLGMGGPLLAGTSNYAVGLDNQCLAGVAVRDSARTLSAAIPAAGIQAATPSSMAGIVAGTVLIIDVWPNEEAVTVTATAATTFTANFANTHAAGVSVLMERSFVARIDQNGIASQVSQDLGLNSRRVSIVCVSPTDPNVLYCATDDQRLWMTNNGATANAATVWSEVVTAKPPALSISSIAIDNAGGVYVLLTYPITTGADEFSVTSPLFQISGGSWVHLACQNLPAGFWFGNLVSDPVAQNTMYAGHGARVYRVALSNMVWDWQDISEDLPGQWIYDLWVGDIAEPGQAAKVILRAAIPTRGIWERDVTSGATSPAIDLYMRDNVLDQGWLVSSPDGLQDPFNPADPGATVFHYQCADIKIDALQRGTAGVGDFYQTDPEVPVPPPHVRFDELNDNSNNLPQSDQAWLHIQVHNRSHTTANNVRVWALYCNASAGVPALNTSASLNNAFDFWSQFGASGIVVPALPADSPWKSVGAPRTVSKVEASTPQVASWPWTVPALPSGDPGHYCIVAFVHSAVSPINETSMNVDEISPRNRQVGQKNVHIGPPLPPSPGPGAGGGGGSGGAGGRPRASDYREYIEFHNPSASAREATLVFDLRGLPSALQVSLQLAQVDTALPLRDAITGVGQVHRISFLERWLTQGSSLLHWLASILDRVACWVGNVARRLGRRPRVSCGPRRSGRTPAFSPVILDASPSERVQIRGVRIAPFDFCAARVSIANTGDLEPGSVYQFQVQQESGGRLLGGSTFVVRISGESRRNPQIVVSSHRTDLDLLELRRIEREAERLKYVPPWAKDIVEKREREQGRHT